MDKVGILTRDIIFGNEVVSGNNRTNKESYKKPLKLLEDIGYGSQVTDFAALLKGISSYWTLGYTNGKPEIFSGRNIGTAAIGDLNICVRPILSAAEHPQNYPYEVMETLAKEGLFFKFDNKFCKVKVAVYGEYPQKIINEEQSRMIITDTSSVKSTGKKYEVGGVIYDELVTPNGKKFVIVKTDKNNLVEVNPLVWLVDEETDMWVLRDLPAPVKLNGIGKFCERFEKDLQPSIVIRQAAAKKTTFLPNGKQHKNGFLYDTLSNDELLQMYVRAGVPVFLHGPSGVGKTQRVLSIDPTATRITLRPQMNPEEIDGILDRENRSGGYIPPLWHTQLCSKCEYEPNNKHILFIDELTNVKPTVQSLVYSIVLERAGKDGLWPLPENSVVVAAGNEKAGNLAAFPLTNALFRRFSHIYYDVNVSEWLGWALGEDSVHIQPHHRRNEKNRTRVHPVIVGYIASRNESVLYQDLDEDEPHVVTDPRKWKIASDVLYETRNPKALLPAIGEELTADFVEFTLSIKLTVKDILEANYEPQKIMQMDMGRKFATITGLMECPAKHLPAVNTFIDMYLGKEIGRTYTELWTLYNKNKTDDTYNTTQDVRII